MSGSRGRGSGSSREPLLERLSKPKMTPPSSSSSSRKLKKHDTENLPPEDENLKQNSSETLLSPSPSKNLQARPVKSPRNLPPRPPSAKRKLGLDTINEGSGSSQDTGAKVIIRIRPMRAEMETTQIVNLISSNTIAVVDQQFTFDTVAGVESTQKDIFELVGAPLVENCLAGFNSSIFAYGQTGSGKTYTMWGPMFEKTSELFPNKDRGLTPRVFEQLFSRVQEEEANNIDKQLRYQCRCSFLEIYNEHIIDLLEPNQGNLQIREDVKSGVYVENLTEEYVSNVDDVTLLALKGLANRKVGATSMNVESSRSHSVFTCVLESRYKCASTGLSSLKTSRINLVDLAGSERQKTTGAAGERLKESGNINRSLSHLGNLIKILAEVSRTGKQRHIPYRDSRLTFLLQESLGGNAKLAMICAISPAASCRSETLSTLRFAQRAKAIQNKAVVNEETEDDVNFLRDQIRQLKDELMRMKSQDDQPAGSGVYSTGWNARRSYNILKRSLQHHPLTLPKYDSSSDEEMEIDETAVETVSTASVTQVASFDGMPPKDATVMVNEEKKSNDCQTESDKENVKAPLERKGKVFDDKATQSSFDIESSQNAMVMSSVEMEDIQGALATNTSVISEVKVEENSLILSGSIPFKGTCPTTESQVSGVSNVTDMLEGMIVKKEEDLVPSRSISLEDLCGITEPQVTEGVSETQVKVDVFETNISEEKIVNNEENDLVLSDNTSLKDVLRVTEPQVTEGASKTQVTEDVSERNISEEKIVNKEENDLVPSDNISLKDVHGVTKPQVTKDALKTQVTKDVSETNISEENIVNKKENDLVPNDNTSLKDLREVNEPQVTEDASEIQVTENASETNISEENIVNKEENDLVPNDSNSFIDLSEVPKPQVTEHPFEEQPTETSISISIGEELSECEKHEALVTEKVAEELPTVQVDEKSSRDEFEFCIPQDLSSTDAENKENLVGEIKPQIVIETHDNGEHACNSTSFSIVPEQDSSNPVLASPPMSVSPTLKSGRRDNQRPPPSFGDSSSEWGSEGPNLSFAQSVAIKKSTEGAVSSVDRLAASLQHGLKVIDQHAAIRKSSVRFSMQAFNMQAPQFQLLTEKVDKSVQTEMLDSTGSLSAKDGQDNSHLQLVAVEADKLSPDKQIYLSTAVEGVLAGSIRRELATEEVCSRQAAEIEHLNRLVNQYKHERDCNSILQQARDEKIARLENLLNGVLSKDDFLKDELDALSFEHKVLKEKYENHPEVTLAKIEEARLNDELEKYRNFFHLGERDVLQEEIKDLRNQLQQYLDRGGVHVSTKKLRQSLLMRSTQKLEAKDDSNGFALNTVPELPSLDMENIMSDKQWEEENRLWRERENEWISLVDDLRKEVASATRLAEKRKAELESEQKCSEEMKEALKISLAGHTRFLEQFAELQENYMSLLAKHKAIREGTAEARTVAIKAGCKGAQLKIIEDLGGQVIALKQERDQIRRCAKKEIDGLQAQLRDTVDAVQAAGELVVRLKEAEEAVALAQDFASHSEQNAENLRREIEKLKRMHATELAAFNQRLRESRLGMSSICTMCQFAERAKYDFESSEDCPVAEEEEKENSDKENTGGASNPLCEEGGLDYDDDVLRQDTSWFSGYDKCNI